MLIVLRIGAIMFVVEGLVMLALQVQVPSHGAMGPSEWGWAAFDAGVLVLFSSPLIYSWVIRPYVLARNRAEAELRQSEHTLQERVEELEDTKSRLEQQGEHLVALAEDLDAARDRADAANQAKTEFLAAMSHELRTPLNAIIGFSEIIKSETFGPVGSAQYRGYAEDIHASGQHLLDLINDILNLSKVEAGSEELHEEDVDAAAVAQSVLRLVQQRAKKGGIGLELDIPNDLPPLRADERKLKQILVNLLTNAIKFTDSGGRVTLKTRIGADGGYLFQVIDTGIGMAPEDIPKALSQFGQVAKDLDRRQEGTGLGLPLAKSYAELHGGRLDVHSRVGVGTTVTVRFPAFRVVSLAATGS
jgi:signal transduction histidine kinase